MRQAIQRMPHGRQGWAHVQYHNSSWAWHQMDEAVTGMAGPKLSTGVRQKLTSKMIIDATKPPTSDPEKRALFERLTPVGLDKLPRVLK